MPYSVSWLRMALQDMEDIASYIAQDDKVAAQQVAQQILEAGQSLGRFPERARVGRVPGTRELVLDKLPFFIAFRMKDNIVQILRIVHTARQYPLK